MVTSTDAKKAFDQIEHSFVTQILSKVGIKGNFLIMIKALWRTYIYYQTPE